MTPCSSVRGIIANSCARPWPAEIRSSRFPNDGGQASPRCIFSTFPKSWHGQTSTPHGEVETGARLATAPCLLPTAHCLLPTDVVPPWVSVIIPALSFRDGTRPDRLVTRTSLLHGRRNAWIALARLSVGPKRWPSG